MKRFAVSFAIAIVGLAAASACNLNPPTGQLVVYVDTDAPVPPGAGRVLGPNDPAPLFDSLRIEVFPPGESTPCAGCVREFPVDADKLGRRAISVGVPAEAGVTGYRLRATLFLQDWVVPCVNFPADDRAATPACATADPTIREPHPRTTLSRTVTLPAVTENTIDEVSLSLDTGTVGAPQGSPDAPLAVDLGKPVASRVGTWEGAKRRGCASAPRPGEACVPAGAFWSGNPRAIALGRLPVTPHLVVLSPFFLKTTEGTVGECRSDAACASYASAILNGPKVVYCDYTKTAGNADALALNCMLPAGGAAYCASWGGTLASSAELEYAGRGMVGNEFVWGYDEPACEDAIWGRADDKASFAKGPCYVTTQGPSVPGSGKRDRLVLESGTIVDLDGNVQEWTRDVMGPKCECAQPAGVLHDPVCNDPSGASNGIVGGAWAYGALALAPGPGGCGSTNFIGTVIGFRCSRPGE